MHHSNFEFFKFNFHTTKFLNKKEDDLTKHLSDTSRGFFNFTTAISIVLNKNTIKCHGTVDKLQSLKTQTCGAFVLYFLYHLYQKCPARQHKKCTIDTVKEVIGLIFDSSSTKEAIANNELRVKKFINDNGIKGNFY